MFEYEIPLKFKLQVSKRLDLHDSHYYNKLSQSFCTALQIVYLDPDIFNSFI